MMFLLSLMMFWLMKKSDKVRKIEFIFQYFTLKLKLFAGIKDYSSWPTIPQVFFKGEFIGGCDILLQMHQSGELVEELEKIGIKSALLAQAEDKKE